MAWIKVCSELWESWKVPALCNALKIHEAQAVGHLISLWNFTERNAWRDGDLQKWGNLGIAKAARWEGTPDDFIEALRVSGFMDGFKIHQWTAHQAGLIHDRERRTPAQSPQNTCQTPAQSPQNTRLDKSRVDKIREEKKQQEVREFAMFWAAYPRKTGKDTALKSWQTKNPPLDKCLTALEWLTKSPQWLKVDDQGVKGAFIPLPATWLNQGRWNDVPDGHDIVNCSACGAEGALPHGTRGTPICRKCKESEKEKVHGNP